MGLFGNSNSSSKNAKAKAVVADRRKEYAKAVKKQTGVPLMGPGYSTPLRRMPKR